MNRHCKTAAPLLAPVRVLPRVPAPVRQPRRVAAAAMAAELDGSTFNRARSSAAATRNARPIVDVVRRHLRADAHGLALEVASGTGQHAAALADAFPGVTWQPTELSDDAFADIAAHTAARPNVRPPLLLDASADWAAQAPAPLDAVVCINMTHISPWRATLGLLAGSAKCLREGGLLFLYGPFSVDGRPTTPSNADFDASLRDRDPAWGYRDVADVTREAEHAGLCRLELAPMPADNFLMTFAKVQQ